MKPLKVKTKPSHYLMLLLCCLVFVPDVNAQFLKKNQELTF